MEHPYQPCASDPRLRDTMGEGAERMKELEGKEEPCDVLSSGHDTGTASMTSLQLWKAAHNCTRVLRPKA